MCGRYSVTTAPEAIRKLFRVTKLPNMPPRYNVTSTDVIPVVRQTPVGPRCSLDHAYSPARRATSDLVSAPAPGSRSVRLPG